MTASFVTPATDADAVAALVALTVTAVVIAEPLTVTAPATLVAFNAPARFCVTLIVEPPVTVTVPAVWAAAALSSVRVTDTAPVGRVEPPTDTVAFEAVAPVDMIFTEEPPFTTRASPAWAVCVNEIEPVVPLSVVPPPVEATVWDGQRIQFPIVLDNSFTTYERYGVPGFGTVVLVDPDGRIAQGDASTLQAILDKAEPSDAAASP